VAKHPVRSEEALVEAPLSPCPFCGDHAVVDHRDGKHWVVCVNGRCWGSQRGSSEEEAVDRWSHRSLPTVGAATPAGVLVRRLADILRIIVASQPVNATAWRRGRPGQADYAFRTREDCELVLAAADAFVDPALALYDAALNFVNLKDANPGASDTHAQVEDGLRRAVAAYDAATKGGAK
jgi:hypothetical protein